MEKESLESLVGITYVSIKNFECRILENRSTINDGNVMRSCDVVPLSYIVQQYIIITEDIAFTDKENILKFHHQRQEKSLRNWEIILWA